VRARQVLVVRGNVGTNTGSSPPLLRPAKIPAAGVQEGGEEGNGLESRPPAFTDIRAVSMEICDKATMDFLSATDIGKFQPG